MNYEAVIGIETHAELNTKTKVFCGCRNEYGAPVNTNCCPVCAGMPGGLPTLNQEAVEYALRIGLATHCTINMLSGSDRKNYFYPDLPKAYQISQVEVPICQDGAVEYYCNGEKRSARLTRIHIEEDTGKLLHDERFGGTLIDLNRSGVPLLEIVSEPDLRSAEEVRCYLDTLLGILDALGICNCRLEEGNIRCDLNVSMRPTGQETYGSRVEMKNVSSFSGAFRAVSYEIARQLALLEAGKPVPSETRRWDDMAGENFPMRVKKTTADYRYFPEADLLSIRLEEAQVQRVREALPELPVARFERYLKQYGLPAAECEVLAGDIDRAAFFERCAGENPALAKAVCNWVLGDISRMANEKECKVQELGISSEALLQLISLQQDGQLSSTAAKTVLEQLVETGDAPIAIVERLGLRQVSDTSVLKTTVREVLDANPGPIEEYRRGKTNVLGFLVGQCMKRSAGKGNPQVFGQLLQEELSG